MFFWSQLQLRLQLEFFTETGQLQLSLQLRFSRDKPVATPLATAFSIIFYCFFIFFLEASCNCARNWNFTESGPVATLLATEFFIIDFYFSYYLFCFFGSLLQLCLKLSFFRRFFFSYNCACNWIFSRHRPVATPFATRFFIIFYLFFWINYYYLFSLLILIF